MEYTVRDHFTGKEQVVSSMYDKLLKELMKFGPVRIEPKKTSIHLCNRFGFAGVYTRKDYINPEVHLSHKVSGKKVSKVEQASANRYHHTIKLTSPKDIDMELLGWLKEAYILKA